MGREGIVDDEWQESDAGERKYDTLTAKGKAQLAERLLGLPQRDAR